MHRGALFIGTSVGSGEVHEQFSCIIAAIDFAALATAIRTAIMQNANLGASTGHGGLVGNRGNLFPAGDGLVRLLCVCGHFGTSCKSSAADRQSLARRQSGSCRTW